MNSLSYISGSYKAKIKVLGGCIPPRSFWGESTFLPFSDSYTPWLLALTLLILFPPHVYIVTPPTTNSIFLPPFKRNFVIDYIGFTQIIRDNLPISRFFT